MQDYRYLLKQNPELSLLYSMLRDEFQRFQRPANETILLDENVLTILGISKRKLEYMKADREISFLNPPMQRDYYLLSDLLEWLLRYRIECILNERRI
jgi:hypothetical protein